MERIGRWIHFKFTMKMYRLSFSCMLVLFVCVVVLNIFMLMHVNTNSKGRSLDYEVREDYIGEKPNMADNTQNATYNMEDKNHSETKQVHQNSSKRQWDRILSLDSFGKHNFNATASDLTPLHRDLPETRPTQCRSITYNTSTLPKTTVIIPFHNEAWSTLLRTVHSVIDKTPGEILKEIILVDDQSTHSYLLSPLEDYIAMFDIVRLFRMPERSGLMHARMKGAELAKGEVLFFMDSHCEVSEGWLQPVLARIQEKRDAVIIPTMNMFHIDSFKFWASVEGFHGTFDWRLVFKWKKIPGYDRESTKPINTPIMVGCAFGINRDYFYEIGAYDAGMQIWGGENIEHSFRIWMCGGSLETLPCSHVAHVFKPGLPYKFGKNVTQIEIIQRNYIRLAKVWMDEYKHVYYATEKNIQEFDDDILQSRIKLRETLKCKNFEWYLKNILSDTPLPSVRRDKYFGQLKHYWTNDNCVQLSNTSKLITTSCNKQPLIEQSFHIDVQGRFMCKDICFRIDKSNNLTVQRKCIGPFSYTWVYDDYMVKNKVKNLCLTFDEANDQSISIKKCNYKDRSQKWKFAYEFNWHI